MANECCSPQKKSVFQRPLPLVTMLAFLVVCSTAFVDPWRPVWDVFLNYVSMMWWAVGLGIFLSGVVDRFLPQTYIQYYLSRRKKRTILVAVCIGFMMSVCSHGIVAIAAELYKKKAAPSSIIAFLLAAPWSNMSITLLLIVFFGLKAFVIIGVAICIAVVTGLIFQVLEEKGMLGQAQDAIIEEKPDSLWRTLKHSLSTYKCTTEQLVGDAKAIWVGMKQVFNMVGWWVLLGTLLASIAAALIPHGFMSMYMGATFLGMLSTLGVATIIEVCSEGTAPLAFELYQQTGAFGNVLVFLMAGVATDYTEIAVIWSVMGKRVAFWMLTLTIPQILIWGYLINIFI